MKNVFFILFFSVSQTINAAEADNFTARIKNVKEVKNELNSLANKHLKAALARANQNPGCNEERLYDELKKDFSNHTKGQFTINILKNNVLPTTVLPIQNTIYKNWKPIDGVAMGIKSKFVGKLSLSPLIKVQDQIIGVDKLEHMFGMGWKYYQDYYEDKESLYSTLKKGALKEKFILGGTIYVTGVFSYADLSANFNGMRFWNNILGKSDDVLGVEFNIPPYVLCQNNQWIANDDSPIDFSHYIDASMDESVNCSKFARRKTMAKMDHIVHQLGKKIGENFCEFEKEKLNALKIKYANRNIYTALINFWGIGQFSYKDDI